jgi:putative FmdB family regulatory protein
LPLYEYECPKDGTFERIQKFSDPPLEACPTCGGPIEKLASAPAIQFKGTGWYITDYARKGDGAGKKDGGKDAGKDTGKETGKETGKDTGSADKGSSEASKTAASATSSSDSKSGSSSGSSDKK